MEQLLPLGDAQRLRELNDEFHSILYEAAGNQRLVELIDNLWVQYHGDGLWAVPEVAERFVEDHHDILAAVQNGDAPLVLQCIARHITYAGERVIEHIRKYHRLPS
jgi:DNA-binding GntR family transcriptional regulator